MNRIEDLLALMQKKEEEKHKNAILWVLAVIGAVTAVAGIAYAVYRRKDRGIIHKRNKADATWHLPFIS